jgi:predicted hotdog family 3-hydroxylacyl-ACP dehydratase
MRSLTPTDIARLLPHSGSMVLLDAVLEYDAHRIHCLAQRHHAADNPLRQDGKLPAWCGLEYAAQAMAVHQGLIHRGLCASDAAPPARGFLAVARDLMLTPTDLDGLPGELHVHAEKIIAEGGRSLYRFHLTSQGQTLLSGRVAVVLQVAPA